MKIIMVVTTMVLFLPVASFCNDSINSSLRYSFCIEMVDKLDLAAVAIKDSVKMEKTLNKNMMEEKDIEKKYKMRQFLSAFEESLKSNTHFLSDMLNIYKTSGCDMNEAIKHMYCPEHYKFNKDCQWVYQEDKQGK